MGSFNRGNRSGGDRGPREFGRRDSAPRSFDRGGFGGRPTMHKAICSKCGKECEIPFRPSGSRPVFCSDCFEKQGGGSSEKFGGGSFSRPSFSKPSFGGDRGDRQMFEATCAKCGDKCQVPFRPTDGKPVFCSNCFEKGSSTGGRNTEHYKEQFEVMNAKLDKILKALNITVAPEAIAKKFEKKNDQPKEIVFSPVEEKAKKTVKSAKGGKAKTKVVAKKPATKKKK